MLRVELRWSLGVDFRHTIITYIIFEVSKPSTTITAVVNSYSSVQQGPGP